MISCRLSTILGAKRLKVPDVCRATGIARATLDRYYNDRVNSFDREVLGKLCDFLQVNPGDLLVVVNQGNLFGTNDESPSTIAYSVPTETIFDGSAVLREPAQKP